MYPYVSFSVSVSATVKGNQTWLENKYVSGNEGSTFERQEAPNKSKSIFLVNS